MAHLHETRKLSPDRANPHRGEESRIVRGDTISIDTRNGQQRLSIKREDEFLISDIKSIFSDIDGSFGEEPEIPDHRFLTEISRQSTAQFTVVSLDTLGQRTLKLTFPSGFAYSLEVNENALTFAGGRPIISDLNTAVATDMNCIIGHAPLKDPRFSNLSGKTVLRELLLYPDVDSRAQLALKIIRDKQGKDYLVIEQIGTNLATISLTDNPSSTKSEVSPTAETTFKLVADSIFARFGPDRKFHTPDESYQPPMTAKQTSTGVAVEEGDQVVFEFTRPSNGGTAHITKRNTDPVVILQQQGASTRMTLAEVGGTIDFTTDQVVIFSGPDAAKRSLVWQLRQRAQTVASEIKTAADAFNLLAKLSIGSTMEYGGPYQVIRISGNQVPLPTAPTPAPVEVPIASTPNHFFEGGQFHPDRSGTISFSELRGMRGNWQLTLPSQSGNMYTFASFDGETYFKTSEEPSWKRLSEMSADNDLVILNYRSPISGKNNLMIAHVNGARSQRDNNRQKVNTALAVLHSSRDELEREKAHAQLAALTRNTVTYLDSSDGVQYQYGFPAFNANRMHLVPLQIRPEFEVPAAVQEFDEGRMETHAFSMAENYAYKQERFDQALAIVRGWGLKPMGTDSWRVDGTYGLQNTGRGPIIYVDTSVDRDPVLNHTIAEFQNTIKNKYGSRMPTEREFAREVMLFVRSKMDYDEEKVNREARNEQNSSTPRPLGYYIQNRFGVCHHMALLAGVLVEKVAPTFFPASSVDTQRGITLFSNSGHVWARWEPRGRQSEEYDPQHIWIIDPANRFALTLSEVDTFGLSEKYFVRSADIKQGVTKGRRIVIS